MLLRTLIPITDPAAQERERLLDAAAAMINASVSHGFVRIAFWEKRARGEGEKRAVVKERDLDPTETHSREVPK